MRRVRLRLERDLNEQPPAERGDSRSPSGLTYMNINVCLAKWSATGNEFVAQRHFTFGCVKAYAAVAVAELFDDYKAIVGPIIDTSGSVHASGVLVMLLAHFPHL